MTDHTTDPLDTLRALRPDPSAGWDTVTSTAVLDRVLAAPAAEPQGTRYSARRLRPVGRGRLAAAGIVAAGAAAAIALGTVAPSGTPGGPDRAAAAALERLAGLAGDGAAGDPVGPGQLAYVEVDEEQTIEPGTTPLPGETRDGDVDRRGYRQWTSRRGEVWLRHIGEGCIEHHEPIDNRASDGEYADLSADQLATLPTDVGQLAAFVDDHPSGDNRGTKNRFVVVGDMVRSSLASPRLRAAALRVLARTDGIEVDSTARDARGRAVIRVQRQVDHGVQSLSFDPATSAVLEERNVWDDGESHYAALVLRTEVVRSLPADVPVCADGD